MRIQFSVAYAELELDKKVNVYWRKNMSKIRYCAQCSAEIKDGNKFCTQCGAKWEGDMLSVQKRKNGKRVLWKRVTLLIIVAVIGAAALFLAWIRSQRESRNVIVYEKDGELYCTDFSDLENIEIKEITENLYYDESEFSSWVVESNTKLSEDGTKLFYPEDCEYSETRISFVLHYLDLNKKGAEAVKIDSDVLSYQINAEGNLITYKKGNQENLYQYNLREKEVIAENVSGFYASEDGNRVIYITEDKQLYVKMKNKEPEKVGRCSYIKKIIDDGKDFYYMKDDALYRKQEGMNKEKIASNVINSYIFEDGKGYFWKLKEEGMSIDCFLEDDMAEIDAELENLGEQGKLERDSWREELESESLSLVTVYYFTDSEITELGDIYMEDTEIISGNNEAVIAFGGWELSKNDNIKLSDIHSEEELEELVYSSVTARLYVCSENQMDSLELLDLNSLLYMGYIDVILNLTGDTLYYLDSYSEDDNLFQASIIDGEIKEPQILETGVKELLFIYGEQLVYYKEETEEGNECYIGGELIDYIVGDCFDYIEKRDSFIYGVDLNSKQRSVTLKEYCKGEKQKIADNVHTWEIGNDGTLFYLTDYDLEQERGELYLYNGNENIFLDEDVTNIIIPTYHSI